MLGTWRRIWELFTTEERRSALVLMALMLIGMVLEMVGLGLVVPALALFRDGGNSSQHPALGALFNSLDNPGPQAVAIIGMLALVGVFILKTGFLLFLLWWQMRFLYRFQAGVSQRLFEGYLRQPYTFHLQRNSAQLISNTVTEVSALLNNALLPAFQLVTDLLMIAGITALIVVVEPVGALFLAFVLAVASFGFHSLTRSRILRWGESRQLHDGLRIQHLQQGLGGVKEVRLLGREASFGAKYRASNLASAQAGQRQSTVSASPRLWLELVCLIGIAALVIVWTRMGRSLETLVPTLGMFVVAAFRLIPSVNRALIAFQGVRYSRPIVDTLHSELGQLERYARQQTGATPMAFERMLTLTNVTFSYPSSSSPAVHSVNLSLAKGSSLGVIGESGAGKSTLVDIILGLLPPDIGSVEVDGVKVETNPRGWQDQIGYVPQSIFLTDDTLRRNVAFGLSDDEIDESAVVRAIRAAQLDRFVMTLPEGLDTLVGERGVRISGGQRQRIGIARALYHDPPVLVLDEATSSLDTVTERGVLEAVRALKGSKTILIVAHRLSTVADCDSLLRLANGRVVEQGEAGALLATPRRAGT